MYEALYGYGGGEKRKGRYNVDAGDEVGETALVLVFFTVLL
jgi:hypothetical protein